MTDLVFATHNNNKLKEIRMMVGGRYHIVSLNDLGCTDEIPETGDTFHANASIKSRFVSEKYQLSCFADDSGLEVPALNNAPGVHSARYAGLHKNDQDNMKLLLHNLEQISNRNARFVTVISLMLDGAEYFFEGTLEGHIISAPRGSNGFGYDPIFVPNGYKQTLAELSPEEKNRISHRGKAFDQLVKFLKSEN